MIITGHYGCGKTNLSVNIALDIAAGGSKCTVIDLDIVNPYFRTADFTELFGKKGIDVKAPVYANSNLDIPSINIPLAEILSEGGYVVMDVGGDDEGAKALGRYAPVINAFEDKQVLYTVNKFRYLSRTAEEMLVLMREIELAGSVRCTGLVNNSNLGAETRRENIEGSLPLFEERSQAAGLPALFTAVKRGLCDDMPGIYPVDIYVKPPWA